MSGPRPTARQVLERFYAAEAAYLDHGGEDSGDLSVFDECLDPNVVVYEAESLPYGGTWRGPQGMADLMAQLAETYSSHTLRESTFFELGDTIFVELTFTVTSRASGRQADMQVLQKNVVRDGVIVEMRPYHWDTAACTRMHDHHPISD